MIVSQMRCTWILLPRPNFRCFTRGNHSAPDASCVNDGAMHPSSKWDRSSAVVYTSMITDHQERSLISLLTEKFQRRRYEQGHWDAVIQNYREIELLDEESDHLKPFLQPIRDFLESKHRRPESFLDGNASLYFSGSWLPCHAIDLHPSGALNAHVDSVRYSGNLVAGLSLLSESIMRLKPSDAAASGYIDLLLPKRSLYVLSGVSRYSYTHELLPSGCLFRDRTPVHRDRRFSIIFRDASDPIRTEE